MKKSLIALVAIVLSISAGWFIWQATKPKPACSNTINVPANATPAEIKQITDMAKKWCLDNGYSVN